MRATGRAAIALLVALSATATARSAQELTAEKINAAELSAAGAPGRATLIKAQVLLDRARISPGTIDGEAGENTRNAIAVFQKDRGLEPTGKLDAATWTRLTETSSEPVLHEYVLTTEDVRGPFAEEIPDKMEKQADLKRLAYTSAQEAIAEKFHLSEKLLAALNPKASFAAAGETITVARVSRPPVAKVAKVEISKGEKVLRVIGENGELLAAFPVSVGSEAKPAPGGTLKVASISRNPNYTYNPDFAFKDVKAKQSFRIAPGPNNPVGSVWIDLGGDGYGLHGTPEPDKVGKSASHGCIRLTNWDAETLARAVRKGTQVAFLD